MKYSCPDCGSALFQAKTAAGEILVCQNCGGKGFSAALLDLALTPLVYRRVANQFKTTAKTSALTCPICSAPFRTVKIDFAELEHTIEICSTCGFSWFDHNEFESIPRRQDTLESFKLPEAMQRHLNEFEIAQGKRVAARSRFRVASSDFGFGWDKKQDGRVGIYRWILALFFIPVERQDRISGKPWASLATLMVIALVSLYGWQSPGLINQLALSGYQSLLSMLWHSFTYGLVHGNYEHLLGNLYYLWFFGNNVEDEYGGKQYALLLLLGTSVSGLIHVMFDSSGAGLIGISGGVSALGMIYTMKFPRAKVALFIGIGWLRFPAYVLTGIWIFMQILLAKDQLQGLSNISALAHLGGAIFGLAAYQFYLKKSRS